MSVLIRRAPRERNSIIGWFPNELLMGVMRYSSQLDLVALSRTSRLCYDIAMRLLYHTVTLSTGTQIESWLRTMESTEHPTLSLVLCDHVRRFTITNLDVEWEPNRFLNTIQTLKNLSSQTVEALISILAQLHHLEFLELTDGIEFTDTLLDCLYFKTLFEFEYRAADSQISSLLPSFLNQHPTITHLSLVNYNGPLQQWDTIHLPNLTKYMGPNFLIPLFTSESIRMLTEACLGANRSSDDLDIEAALLRLATMPALHRLVIVHDMEDSTLFRSVANHVPRIGILRFGKAKGFLIQMSSEDTHEIAVGLEKFDRLSNLSFVGVYNGKGLECDDRPTIELWSRACKSLSSIGLHYNWWDQSEGHWERM
ncbi:hypothetical protein MSAN_00955600 [Mycena sanguinolenta]|uniref:F-box domain-containing protein n=1 Tax=Mycena sanguinolenta TaxID=230812 RepID=A0A8H7D988_9AGAR|nr:hypothetical protein MSAN_00955600 [Mycena sanguinolenta]